MHLAILSVNNLLIVEKEEMVLYLKGTYLREAYIYREIDCSFSRKLGITVERLQESE